jgi:hypothetical protein
MAPLHLSAQEEPVHHVEIRVDQPGFQSSAAQDVTINFKGLNATFKSSSPMTVVLETGGTQKSITLPAEFAQLTSARVYRPNRLVITGMVNGDAWETVIVDPEKGSIVDHFLCYDPAISPDGRYVVFIKFYPAHGVDSVEDHYMLYDVQLSPEQNRPTDGVRHPSLVGKVMFPAGMANRLNDNVDLGDQPTHRVASDSFFWNDQSTSVVFADQFRDDYVVVVVNIANGAFTSDSVSVPKQSICDDISPCSEHLTRVDFDTLAPGINVAFRGVNGTPSKESQVVVRRNSSGNLEAALKK